MALSNSMTSNSSLLSLDDVSSLTLPDVRQFWRDHLNPGQLHFLKLLGFDHILIDRAEGAYYIDSTGRKILDLFGGFGAVGFGHNHPRIVAARRQFEQEQRPDICMAFLSKYAAGLAANLALLSPDSLNKVFLCTSGSEAVEAALKICEQASGPQKSSVVYATNSFHGKTKGALTVTDSALYRQQFGLSGRAIRVQFGDLNAIQALFEQDPSIGTIVLETIQGGGGINSASREFWHGLRTLCNKHKVYWIADEIQCGMGRTGLFYAFEHHGVVPDVITLAKSLGGSKTAMAATIVRDDLFKKAYGTGKTALINVPGTFGGIGEGCATAIEALNILYDDALIENASLQGDYMIEQLSALAHKYPLLLKEVRGQGLMIGVEFHDISQSLPWSVKYLASSLDERLKGSLCGFFGALLLARNNILVGFTEYNRNVIRLEPPLNITREQVDVAVEGFDNILSLGVVGLVKNYIAMKVKSPAPA